MFWTVEDKGWGIRSTENIPQGAFVFEFVGEILTNNELEKRMKIGKKRKLRHVPDYSLVLDDDEYMEEVLTDDEALCLDAWKFGNIARFLNHRCGDANLVHYNVHIERRSTQLYHVFPYPMFSSCIISYESFYFGCVIEVLHDFDCNG